MDKPLPEIKKDIDVSKRDEPSPALPASGAAAPASKPDSSSPQVTISAYAPELSYKNWVESRKNLRWDSTPQGRATIRLFSRGVLGAAAFAAGNWYVNHGGGMSGYKPDIEFSGIKYNKPLQYVAKSIDTVFGKPIKFTARLFGASEQAAENLVRFRPTSGHFGRNGRSLGEESVNVTFDFFCASIGDAIGRDIANILDPHVKHDWKDEKGHIKYPEAARNVAKSLWRYVSYNGGEDWAVAVPYAYYLRGQRKLINHFSPGFSIDSDRGFNGGSFKVDKDGKITGNYNLEGMLDLQGRFTAYNIGTLMYREVYNHIGAKLHGEKSSLYGSVDDRKNEKQGIAQNIGNLCKWMARSVVKGIIYMTPAVPFFSIFRTSQSKYKGLFINPDMEANLCYKAIDNQGNDKYYSLQADEYSRSPVKFNIGKGIEFRRPNKTTLSGFESVSGGKSVIDGGGVVANHPLSQGHDLSAYSQGEGNYAINKIGQGQNAVRSRAVNLAEEKLGWGKQGKNNIDTFVNAAFAYTPYMYAKGEAAQLWDSGRMDSATERMIDGAAGLNFREFKAGASEVWREILHKPLADPLREANAQKRLIEDISPADALTETQANLAEIRELGEHDHFGIPSWRQRIIHGSPPEKQKIEKQPSYTEQEEMRKALSELHPPTNAIH